jgi:Tfp pilus assembly protein PilN
MVAGALIGVVLVCGGLFGVQLLNEQQDKRELSSVTQEIEVLQPVMQQVQKNRALKAQIDARTGILAQIERERPVKWSAIILQLGQATPDHLWLTELANDVNGNIIIKGGTNDIDTVTKYVENLRQIPNIANVSFVGLVQTNLNEKAGSTPAKGPEQPGLNMITYDLNIRLKGGAQR